jgi:hypothetical protein
VRSLPALEFDLAAQATGNDSSRALLSYEFLRLVPSAFVTLRTWNAITRSV